MKEAIGGISIFQIVIIFILLFTAIMALTINHSKAFAVKDEVINILENTKATSVKNKKVDNNTITKIVEALRNGGYRIVGNCPNGYIGYNRDGAELGNGATNASFCIKTNLVNESYKKDLASKCKNDKCIPSDEYLPMVYYDVRLFYQLDIPIIRNIFNFTVNGSTKVLFG